MLSGQLKGEFLYNHDKIRMQTQKLKTVDNTKYTENEVHSIQQTVSGFYTLVYCRKNDAVVFIDGKRRNVPGNSMFVADKFSTVLTFSKSEQSPCTITAIDFKSTLFGIPESGKKDFCEILNFAANICNTALNLPENYFLRDKKGRLERLFNDSDEEYRSRSLNYTNLLKNNIQAILTEIARDLVSSENKSVNQSDFVQQIIDYTQTHYTENLTLDKISEIFHYSPSYVTKRFMQELDMSFSDFLRQYRIYIACRMLKKENTQINTIMRNVGFNNTANFIKIFKKYIGMTPREYRIHVRKSQEWFIGLSDFKIQKNFKISDIE